jgi:hypothetical protein
MRRKSRITRRSKGTRRGRAERRSRGQRTRHITRQTKINRSARRRRSRRSSSRTRKRRAGKTKMRKKSRYMRGGAHLTMGEIEPQALTLDPTSSQEESPLGPRTSSSLGLSSPYTDETDEAGESEALEEEERRQFMEEGGRHFMEEERRREKERDQFMETFRNGGLSNRRPTEREITQMTSSLPYFSSAAIQTLLDAGHSAFSGKIPTL